MSRTQLDVATSSTSRALGDSEIAVSVPTIIADGSPGASHTKSSIYPPLKGSLAVHHYSSILFRLPREIRNKIYAYVLTSLTPISWPSTHARPSGNVNPGLVLTSRTIHAEASPILYANNPLIFTHPSDANVFIHCIGSPEHTSFLSTVYFHVVATDLRLWTAYLNSTSPFRSLTHDFPSLRQLQIFFLATRHSHQSPFNPHMDPLDGFRQWQHDMRLRQLILSLEDKTDADVKVICSVKMHRAQLDVVRRVYLDTGELVEDADDRDVLRTGMRELFGCSVALELRAEDPRRRLPLERLADQM